MVITFCRNNLHCLNRLHCLIILLNTKRKVIQDKIFSELTQKYKSGRNSVTKKIYILIYISAHANKVL